MIISRTPLRVSFFGGSTDYPVWYRENPGAVLATTIDKYCWVTCRYLPPFFEHKHRIVWSFIELVQKIDDIKHPGVRETLKFMKVAEGLEIHYDGDLPSQTGLGSSSAFVAGLLHALYAMKGIEPADMQLALSAIHIEQELIRENVGSQDQTMAAFGGFNRVDFLGDNISVTPIQVPPERLDQLQSHLMLLFTGFQRTASQIAGEQIKETPSHVSELKEMYYLVKEAENILCSDTDLVGFGKLLHESWKLKRSLTSKISTPYIDYLYDKAINAGAIGGKITGAGGGGFLLLFVTPELQSKVKESLGNLLHVPFRFEDEGSKVIFNG